MTSPRIPAFRPEELGPEQASLYELITGGPRVQGPQHFALTRRDGSLRGPFNALLLAPAVGGALQELGSALRYRSTLPDATREIAILLVAGHWRSDFEREAHEPIARAAGVDHEAITDLRALDISRFDGDERIAAQTVLALLGGDLTDEQWQDAETLGAHTVFELTTLVGYYSTLALQLRAFRA